MIVSPARRGVLLVALSAAGCGVAAPSVSSWCAPVESTGGDPTGNWDVTKSCQVPYARTATDDWCSHLVYGTAHVVDGLILGQEFLEITGGTIKYEPDPAGCGQSCGIYEAALVFSNRTTTHFPLGCLKQHTPDPTCDDLGIKIQTLVEMNVLPTIQDVHCTAEPDDPDSCACDYLVTTATIAPDVGAWRVRNGLLIHYPGTLAQAGLTDIAIDGNVMRLHGHDGMPLLAHDPLRSLDLVRKP